MKSGKTAAAVLGELEKFNAVPGIYLKTAVLKKGELELNINYGTRGYTIIS